MSKESAKTFIPGRSLESLAREALNLPKEYMTTEALDQRDFKFKIDSTNLPPVPPEKNRRRGGGDRNPKRITRLTVFLLVTAVCVIGTQISFGAALFYGY